MRDLYLDPATGDLALDAGRARLTTPGAEAVAQRLRKRFELWKREYILDQDAGIPYLTLFGKGSQGLLEATLRSAAVTCPGVVTIEAFALTVDPTTRAAAVSLASRATDGEPFSLDAFAVGTL